MKFYVTDKSMEGVNIMELLTLQKNWIFVVFLYLYFFIW